MARRGFLATLAHQARIRAREQERAQRAAVQAHNAAVRRAQQARKAAERAKGQLDREAQAERKRQVRESREAQAERKRLERESREAHIAAMEAETEEHNLKLAEVYEEIDALLAHTLGIDDYVNLETLRAIVDHPPFGRTDLEVPTPAPPVFPDPLEPSLVLPEPPTGLARLFGKKKHVKAVEKARQSHAHAIAEWRGSLEQAAARRVADLAAHSKAEAKRVAQLEAARSRYEEDCAARERDVVEQNKELDELIAHLGYATAEAVQEYVEIVLSNSVYPEHFPVTHRFDFDTSAAELTLRVLIPGPDKISDVKEYKYSKTADEIAWTSLSQKVCRERYAGAVHQVALRSLHEIFEADRRGIIKTISLEVGTETVDPATGQSTYVPFAFVGAARESFLQFDLSAVVPALTLAKLGASVSKNPFGLVAAEKSGVRRS